MSFTKAIIFDLGGVIINLDQDRTLRAFKRLGVDLDQINENHPIFKEFEIGKIDADGFRNQIRAISRKKIADNVINEAWNKMLLDIPAERITLLSQLRKQYRILLLSNTNTIHMDGIYQYTSAEFGAGSFENMFDKIYLSHEIGMRKPDADTYKFILSENQLMPHESIFIDDSKINCRGAEEAGIRAIWAKEPLD